MPSMNAPFWIRLAPAFDPESNNLHVPALEQCACVPFAVEQSASQCAPAKPSAHSHGGSSVAAPPLASHVPADEQCACVPLAVEQSTPQRSLVGVKLFREGGRAMNK